MPNKDLLLQYAKVKIQISKYESELEMLKDQVLEEILKLRGDSDQPIDLSELPGYTFTVQKRKNWIFTPAVSDLSKALEARKTLEKQTGDATFTENEILVFNQPKE